MVKVSDINKDIRSISEKVGVAVFSYDDIHNENINNEFHYDYERVIAEVSRLQKIAPEEAEAQLVDRGILKPLPGGEYEVDVGETTRNGGGINYSSAFFSLSSKDYQIKYHELAHSLQEEYHLFDDEKVRRLYETAEKGLKDSENKKDKLLDRRNYRLYLNEMHSETFGYAALMLRAENRRDFLWQAVQAYNNGVVRNANAILSFGKTEYGTDSQNSSKFYATKSVMKPLIKMIWKIRKKGRQGDFFDENGVLKDEKLARLCEEVVIKNAYSPRTLKAFFEYKVFDGHSRQERGWRRDTLKALLQKPVATIRLLQEGSVKERLKSIYKHNKLVAAQNKKLEKFIAKRKDYGNPELTALKEYERLQTKILLIDKKLPGQLFSTWGRDLLPNMVRKEMPDSSVRYLANVLGKNPSETKVIEEGFKSINKLVNENKGNPYFEKLVQAELKGNQLHRIIQEKQQNPQKEITSDLFAKKENYDFGAIFVEQEVEGVENFAEKHHLDSVLKEALLETIIKNPQALEDTKNRDILISAHMTSNNLKGKKKKEFIKDFNLLMDSISFNHFSNQENPFYQEALQVLSKQPAEKYAEKIAEMSKQEQKAFENNEPVRFADEKLKEPAQEPVQETAVKEQTMQSQVQEETKQTQLREDIVPRPFLSPRERVDAEMATYGIAKGSYMLFTAEDKDLETGYGIDSLRKVDAYLHNQKETQEAGTDKIMGKNNGLTAVYFVKEDVYLVTANPEVAEAMQYSSCKDVGLGVMFSNGERIINDAAKLAEWQQVRSMGENIAQKKWEEQSRRNEKAQETAMSSMAEKVVTATENTSNQPQDRQQPAVPENPSIEKSGTVKETALVTVSTSFSAQEQTNENTPADLKKLLLEKSGRLNVSSKVPVKKTGIDLQTTRLKSAAHDR